MSPQLAAVEFRPGQAGRKCAGGDIRKRAVVVVAVQERGVPMTRDEQIGPAVVVEIAGRGATRLGNAA